MISFRTLTGYAGYSPAASIVARKISAYALISTPALISVRKVAAYALASPRSIPAKNKTSLALLYEIINNNSKSMVFTETDLIVTNPQSVDYQGYNSKVNVATTILTKNYSGNTFLFYNRIPILNHFINDLEIGFAVPANTTIHTLLPLINTAHNLLLTTADVVDGPVLTDPDTITLTGATTSFLYIPGSVVQIAKPAVSLVDVVKVKDLSGFDPSTT